MHNRKTALFFVSSIFICLLCVVCKQNKMSAQSHPVEPETILKHAASLYTSLAFYVGTQLDVYTELDAKAMTVEAAAEAMNMTPNFMKRLLYALAASELLTVEKGIFSNTTETSHVCSEGQRGGQVFWPDRWGHRALQAFGRSHGVFENLNAFHG